MTTATKSRPILFNGEMVRAILDGRKTQTRRTLKLQPDSSAAVTLYPPGKGVRGLRHADCIIANWPGESEFDTFDCYCPFGQPGDELWVRETWGEYWQDHNDWRTDHHYVYRADDAGVPFDNGSDMPWRPSIHMPRGASRITLEITDVRVERVQDISIDDMVCEGIDLDEQPFASQFDECEMYQLAGVGIPCSHPELYPFVVLWNSIYGKTDNSWKSNPWVWVIEFRVKEIKT